MRLLSLAVASPVHSVKESNQILTETIALIGCPDPGLFIGANDYTKVVDICATSHDLIEEVDDYRDQLDVKSTLHEVLSRLMKFLGHLERTSQMLIDLGAPYDQVAFRIDAWQFYGALASIAEDGMMPHLEEMIAGWETQALEQQTMEPHPTEIPPTLASIPLFAMEVERAQKKAEEHAEWHHTIGSYILGQCETLRSLQELHVLVNRE